MVLKIMWGITGSGDYMPEIIKIMKENSEKENIKITIALSKEAVRVTKWYKVWKELQTISPKPPIIDEGPNMPFIAGDLQYGRYNLFLIAPLTANSTAKIAHGIADTLITNAFAQCAKGKTPIYILPIDQETGTKTTILPSGEKFELTIREIDVENVNKIKTMKNITVLKNPEEIYDIIKKHIMK